MAEELRDRPKRDKLSEREMAALRSHVNRHDNWSVSKLSDFCWVTEELVEECRA